MPIPLACFVDTYGALPASSGWRDLSQCRRRPPFLHARLTIKESPSPADRTPHSPSRGHNVSAVAYALGFSSARLRASAPRDFGRLPPTARNDRPATHTLARRAVANQRPLGIAVEAFPGRLQRESESGHGERQTSATAYPLPHSPPRGPSAEGPRSDSQAPGAPADARGMDGRPGLKAGPLLSDSDRQRRRDGPGHLLGEPLLDGLLDRLPSDGTTADADVRLRPRWRLDPRPGRDHEDRLRPALPTLRAGRGRVETSPRRTPQAHMALAVSLPDVQHSLPTDYGGRRLAALAARHELDAKNPQDRNQLRRLREPRIGQAACGAFVCGVDEAALRRRKNLYSALSSRHLAEAGHLSQSRRAVHEMFQASRCVDHHTEPGQRPRVYQTPCRRAFSSTSGDTPANNTAGLNTRDGGSSAARWNSGTFIFSFSRKTVGFRRAFPLGSPLGFRRRTARCRAGFWFVIG